MPIGRRARETTDTAAAARGDAVAASADTYASEDAKGTESERTGRILPVDAVAAALPLAAEAEGCAGCSGDENCCKCEEEPEPVSVLPVPREDRLPE